MLMFICLYSLVFSFVLACHVIALLNKNKRSTSEYMDCETHYRKCCAIFRKVEEDGK